MVQLEEPAGAAALITLFPVNYSQTADGVQQTAWWFGDFLVQAQMAKKTMDHEAAAADALPFKKGGKFHQSGRELHGALAPFVVVGKEVGIGAQMTEAGGAWGEDRTVASFKSRYIAHRQVTGLLSFATAEEGDAATGLLFRKDDRLTEIHFQQDFGGLFDILVQVAGKTTAEQSNRLRGGGQTGLGC